MVRLELGKKDEQVNEGHQACLECMERGDHLVHRENLVIVNIVILHQQVGHKLYDCLVVIQEGIQSRDLRNINLLCLI